MTAQINTHLVTFNDDGFGGTLFTNEEYSLLLFSYGVYEKVHPHIVHIGDQYGGVYWSGVGGVDVLLYLTAPVYPLTSIINLWGDTM